MTLAVWRNNGQVFCRMLHHCHMSNIFHISRVWLWVFGRKITEVNCLFHPIIATCVLHTTNMIYRYWYWPPPGWSCYVKCLLVMWIFLSHLILYSLEGSHYILWKKVHDAISEVVSYTPSPWRYSIYINYLELFYMGDLSLPFYLLIYSNICLYQYGPMEVYFILWIITQ